MRREPASGAAAAGGAGDPSGQLAVAFSRFMGPDSLAVAVWVCNKGGAAAVPAGATVAFAPHPALAVALHPGAALGQIAPRGSAALLASFSLTGLPTPSTTTADGVVAVSVSGTVTVPGRPTPVPFTLDLPFVDFLRPAPLDTPAFGAAWTQPAMSAEAVVQVPGSSCRTPADFVARITTAASMHPVQAIAATSEVIAAGRLMSTQNLALLHARILPTGLELRAKTGAPAFTQAVLATAAARLR